MVKAYPTLQLKCGASVLTLTSSGISLNGQTILGKAGDSELSMDASSAIVTGLTIKRNA